MIYIKRKKFNLGLVFWNKLYTKKYFQTIKIALKI